MGEVLDMVTKKRRVFDCQNEAVDLTPHFDGKSSSRRVDAAHALAVTIRLIQAEFGDHYAIECLANESMRVKAGGK